MPHEQDNKGFLVSSQELLLQCSRGYLRFLQTTSLDRGKQTDLQGSPENHHGSQVKSHLQLQTPMPDAVCSQLSKLLRSLSHQKLFGGRRIAMASCDIAPSNFSLILPLRSLLLLYLNNKTLCCPSAFRTSSLPNRAQLFTFHKTGLSSSCLESAFLCAIL